MFNKEKSIINGNLISYTFLLLFSYFAIFLHLDTYPLHLWDEATYAVNAIEMHYDGDYLVKHFGGKPEMWATNPPLVCWLQVLCIKILGVNELSIRMPSALACLGVILLVFRYSQKENLGNNFMIFATLFIITSKGYIDYHVVRSGDLDSVVIFFMMGSIIYFYKFIHYENLRLKYLIVFSLFVLFGYMSKGIVCLMLFPAFMIYSIIQKKFLAILKNKSTYLAVLLVLTAICAYYILRESKNPGYIKQAWNNEIASRFTEVNEGHKGNFYHYVTQMWETDFNYFLFFIPLAIISFLILHKKLSNKNHILLWGLCALIFLFLISISETKTEWYDAPFYPMISIFLAFSLDYMIDFKTFKNFNLGIVKFSFIICLFGFPYLHIVKENLRPFSNWNEIAFGPALKSYIKSPDVEKSLEILTTGFNSHALFYCEKYNRNGYNFTIKDVSNKIEVSKNKTYIFSHPAIKQYVDSSYNYNVLWQKKDCYIIKIINEK